MSEVDEQITLYRKKLCFRHQRHPSSQASPLNLNSLPTLLHRSFYPNRADHLHNLAALLYKRFRKRGQISDLEEALVLERNALKLCREGNPDRAISLGNIASCLYTRFKHLGALSDLEEALALERRALEFRPEGHPHRAVSLGNIANYLSARFKQLGVPSDIEEALFLEARALELQPPGHPHRALSLAKLASHLYARFNQRGLLSDLEEALSLERCALDFCPQGHPHRALSLGSIAGYLQARYNQLGALSDLEEALELEDSALGLRPPGHPHRPLSFGNIASCLHARFNRLGALSDLEEALSLERSALELRPPGHSDRAISLGNIASYLYTRFKRLGTLSDLEESLALQGSALDLFPQGHPHRALSLGNIANCLHARFNQVGELSDLEEAILLEQSALRLRSKGHPDRAVSLSNLSSYLCTRFKRLGVLSDLKEALSLERSALELRPLGHPHRALSLGNIASCLHARFNQVGELSDLEEALFLERSALGFRPPGHPDRPFSLGNISSCLYTRFKQLGALSDLEEALAFEGSALELRPLGHPHRALSLGSIASCLHARFSRAEELPDLEEAISLERTALELHPHGHPDHATSLSNIASYLCTRFRRLGALFDLEESLALEGSALELRPPGHPDRAISLSSIASSLYARFELFGVLSDLEESLSLERCALELRPQGHPDRVSSLSNLARYFHARFKHSTIPNAADLQESFNIYSQLSDISQTVSFTDLQHAKQWIQAAEESKHSTTVFAYRTFLRLSVYYLATLPSLPQHLALLKQLMSSMAVDAFSACLRYRNHAAAIELLERGRGVFWNQLMRLRVTLDEVIESGETGKRLADEFTKLALSLHGVLDAPSTMSRHDRACSLNTQLQDVVTSIRQLPGLSCFLQPPLFSNLQEAAAGGPVVILNASQYGCDALVLLSSQGLTHVPLQVTRTHISQLSSQLRSFASRAKIMNMEREFVVLLRELWEVVVFPIAKILQVSCPRGSRIWWCPTAEFSLLPLHAAGPYKKGQLNFTDFYVSSYTPTLTALIRARQNRPLSVEQPRFLLIGQAQAPGQKKLVSVENELSGISERIGSVATVTCIQDQEATIVRVGAELIKHHFVHLACHGIPNQLQPFESGFAIGDGLLKIEHIMRYELQDAHFAYLSACHTTVGYKDSPDEAIHLAAAMQFAGFSSVIGTMWAVDDEYTTEVTSKFYAGMLDETGHLDHTRAALALHNATRSLFSRSSSVPFDQRILYVHIGA